MLYRLMWFTLGPLIRLYWRQRITGRGSVPKDRSAILACNHNAAIDPILVCMSFWRPVRWLAKVELLTNPKVAWFFRSAQVLPIDRDAPEEHQLDAAIDVLRTRNHLFGIFPEGTRSPDGRVYRCYTGVARVAMQSEAPVIPVGIVGTRAAQGRRGKRLARPVACKVRFGAPLRFEARAGEDEKVALRRFADEVGDAIAAITGVGRVVDRYSREVRSGN